MIFGSVRFMTHCWHFWSFTMPLLRYLTPSVNFIFGYISTTILSVSVHCHVLFIIHYITGIDILVTQNLRLLKINTFVSSQMLWFRRGGVKGAVTKLVRDQMCLTIWKKLLWICKKKNTFNKINPPPPPPQKRRKCAFFN